ncbi:hypothetical protein EMCRGX_G016596 [Ephydatia muelleri]
MKPFVYPAGDYELEAHLGLRTTSGECHLTDEIPCPYKPYGCPFMDESLHQPVCHVSGYTAKFVTQLPMRYECPACLSAMRNPVQTECGHLFCRGCLEPILDGPNPLCPLDKTPISAAGVFPDNACKREILSLDVYCDASKNGCPWFGPLKELDSHSQGCEYSDVLCRQCGLNVQNRTFSVHQTKECPMRPVQCQFCNQMIPVGQLELEAHLNPRTGDCPLAEIPCPFKQYGCTFVCERKKMPLHFNEYQIQHTYFQADYSAIMKGQVDKIIETTEHLMKTAELEHGLDRCLSSCLDQELRLQLLERATYNGILLWKIDDFARRRKEAVDGVTMSLYSIPFYTSRHGYKMCARGPFDALLPWPFKQKVSLTIINQAGKKHITDAFCPNPQSNPFQRPNQKEMNVASGCPMFIRHEQLLNGGFVKDDCILLRTVVDTSIAAESLMLK